MVAAHFAVVAGDDDQRRLAEPALLEVVEQPTQPVVHLALGPVVRGPGLAAIPIVERCPDLRHGRGQGRQRVDGRLILGPRPSDEIAYLVDLVEIVIADRIAPGRMGADERGVHEEGLVPVDLEPLGDGLAHEVGLGEVRGEPGRRPRGTVVVGAGEIRQRLVELMRVRGDVETVSGEPGTPRRAPLLPGVVDDGTESG